MEKEVTKLDVERVSGKIEEILLKINSDPNPEELENLKKLIKQNVPFFRRGYFTAMLLKMVLTRPERSERGRAIERRIPNAKKQESTRAVASAPAREEKVLPQGAKTLYLNIGKMKHLYGKDLSKLLQSELGVSREDIYSLRVHDKYSFISMSEENCNKAIEKLNGKEINGRVAQINYSNR